MRELETQKTEAIPASKNVSISRPFLGPPKRHLPTLGHLRKLDVRWPIDDASTGLSMLFKMPARGANPSGPIEGTGGATFRPFMTLN